MGNYRRAILDRLLTVGPGFVRLVLILAVSTFALIYGVMVPRLLDNRFGIVILILPVLVLGAVLLVRWPALGLLAIIISDLLVPFALGTGTQTTLGAPILILAACTGLWALDGLVQKRRMSFLASKPVIPLFVFLGVVILAFLNGQLPWFMGASQAPIRAQLGGLALFFLSALAFLLVGSQVRTQTWLQLLVWVFLGISSIYIIGRMLPALETFTAVFIEDVATGSLFWVWLVSLSLSQALVNHQLKGIFRLGSGLLASAALYIGLVNHAWTSGWLPAAVSAVVILVVGVPRFGITSALAAGASIFFANERASRLLMQGDNEYSMLTRLEAWQILLRMVKTSPLLGFGPSNYYWYTPLFPIRGYPVVFNSHNNYIDLLAQAGLFGLGCFLWFAAALGWLAWQLRARVPAGFQRAYVVGALGGLAGTLAAGLLGDWVIPFVYNVGYTGFRASLLGWMFLGGLVALDQINQR